MIEAKTSSIRAEIMEMFKLKFGGLSIWSRIESDIALMCSELPEPIALEKKQEFIRRLKIIETFLLKHDIPQEDLAFIEEEIQLHSNTKIISLYEEKEDSIEDSVISTYARLARGTEGVVAISQDYNYAQLSALSNGIYQKTGLVKFHISKEKKIYGRVAAEIYEHPQEIPIATVVESRKMNRETGEPMYKGIKLFGEKVPKNEYNVIKEINLPFRVYRFITEENVDLILMSPTVCEIGDYIITGVQTQCDDYKMLTDSARLPTKLPFFFAQDIQNRIATFKTHSQLKRKLEVLGVTPESLFDYPFSITKDKKTRITLHPTWYKWFIWSWLTHEAKGILNNYPIHLMILGPKMSGKSLLINGLHAKSKETSSIFSGSSSTLKHLVPSFKYNPARLGYLAGSSRFAFCDEFLRCLINTRSTKDGSQREESVALMNDLLEHQKREAGSGVSKVNVNMTARIIATTNLIRDMKNVDGLIRTFDESFLSRWLIYHQTEEHVKMIRRSNDADLKFKKFNIEINDWIAILDYLHTFSAEYDLKRIGEIHGDVPRILTENLNKHYDARHMHHIECLMDGIIKTRCILNQDMEFKATEEDYKILKDVWLKVITSWISPNELKNMDVKERINYLPENSQFLFQKLCEFKRPASRTEINEIGRNSLSKLEFIDAWGILLDMNVIKENGGVVRPHYMKDLSEAEFKKEIEEELGDGIYSESK